MVFIDVNVINELIIQIQMTEKTDHTEKVVLKQEELRVELLNEANKHFIAGFTSTVCKDLEDYLKENAWMESMLNYSKTYLFFHGENLAGYITLLTDRQSLKLNKARACLSIFGGKTNKGYTSVPGIKIGRMCVSDEYNSSVPSSKYKGLGRIMFAAVLDKSIEFSGKIGCRVITTHAKKETKAYDWYLKMGFVYSHSDEKTKEKIEDEKCDAIPMFYDIKRIVK